MSRIPTNDVLFESLTTAVHRRNCVAILGAGVSAPDYPLWMQLADELRKKCALRPEDLRGNGPSDIAEAAQRKDSRRYYEALDRIFGRSKKQSPQVARRYHYLARIPFASYITLNFDPRLVEILSLHGNRTVCAYPHLPRGAHGDGKCFHLHGWLSLDRPAAETKIVLTRTEFKEAYDPSRPLLYSFLQDTFLNNHVCFLGCDPSEPFLNGLLAVCTRTCEEWHGLESSRRPNWYMMWDSVSLRPAIEGSGVSLVRYPRVDGLFTGFDNVLAHWAGVKSPNIWRPGVAQVFDDAPEPRI